MISTKDWQAFSDRLAAIDREAAASVRRWVEINGLDDIPALIRYAYRIATKYGEASAALSAAMYDAIAELSGKYYEPAELADTATFEETAIAVNGTLKKSQNYEMLAGAVSRLVKLAGADTILRNAKRDGAQYAWIPLGDTCAYCLMLAAKGWQDDYGDDEHAEHIHSNCNCTYSVRFTPQGGVEGYTPEKYKRIYLNADLDGQAPTEENRLNAMRRMFYKKNKEEINAQKRSAYEKRKELESSAAEEMNV